LSSSHKQENCQPRADRQVPERTLRQIRSRRERSGEMRGAFMNPHQGQAAPGAQQRSIRKRADDPDTSGRVRSRSELPVHGGVRRGVRGVERGEVSGVGTPGPASCGCARPEPPSRVSVRRGRGVERGEVSGVGTLGSASYGCTRPEPPSRVGVRRGGQGLGRGRGVRRRYTRPGVTRLRTAHAQTRAAVHGGVRHGGLPRCLDGPRDPGAARRDSPARPPEGWQYRGSPCDPSNGADRFSPRTPPTCSFLSGP